MKKKNVQTILDKCDQVLNEISGCSDGFCYLRGSRSGQHTNGGCRCVKDFQIRQPLLALHIMRSSLKKLLEEDGNKQKIS